MRDVTHFPLFPAYALSLAMHVVAVTLLDDAWRIDATQPIRRATGNDAQAIVVTLPGLSDQQEPWESKYALMPKKREVTTQPAPTRKKVHSRPAKRSLQQSPRPKTASKTIPKTGLPGSEPHKTRLAKPPEAPMAQPGDQPAELPATPKQQDGSAANAASSGKSSTLPTVTRPAGRSGSTGETSLPKLLRSRQPDYPEEARWEERSGKVIVQFKISRQGGVLDARVKRSSGHRDLDAAALRAMRSWRFDSAALQRFDRWYDYSFRFELN